VNFIPDSHVVRAGLAVYPRRGLLSQVSDSERLFLWQGVTMAITAECPECGFKGNIPDQFKGKKVKCRQCQKLFVVGGAAAAAPAKSGAAVGNESVYDMPSPFADMDLEAPPKKQPASAQGNVKKPVPGAIKKTAGSAQHTLKRPAAKSAPVHRGPFKKKDKEPAPIAAMVLGVLAVILGGAGLGVSQAGMIGLLGVPLGGLGMLLAVGGLVMAWGRPGFGLVAPLLGLLVCLAALPLAGRASYQLIASGALSGDKAKDTASTEIAQGPGDTHPTGGPSAPDTKPSKDTRPTVPTTKPEVPSEEFVDAGRSGAFAKLGDLVVRIKAVETGPVLGKDGKPVDPEKRLLIRLEIENTSADKSISYDVGWGISEPTEKNPGPTLRNQLDVQVKRIVFKDGQVDGQITAQTVNAGKSYPDVVVFELPTDNTQYVKLELPAFNFERQEGKFRFRIPKFMLLGKTPPKEKDPKKELPADMPKFFAEQRAALKKMLPIERERALQALGEIGVHAVPMAAEIAQIMNKDQSETVRAKAAWALGEIGPAAKGHIKDLIAALKVDYFELKANAATALGQMGPLAAEAIPELAKLLDSKDEKVPLAVRRAILRIDPKYKLPPPAKN